jgi:hypothetical protein
MQRSYPSPSGSRLRRKAVSGAWWKKRLGGLDEAQGDHHRAQGQQVFDGQGRVGG